METCGVLHNCGICYMFKSYYVVWKQKRENDFFWEYIKFKSYYVVWKQKCERGHKIHAGKFKSYYVVWKRDRNFIERISLREFKSYYVVWKRQSKYGENMCQLRLNRTMQYGNYTATDKEGENAIV